MADDVSVPVVPALADLPGVELAQAGQWDASTGRATITPDDLAAAVAAMDCPAVRNAIIKLGHTDPRFDGEPAVGWVGGLRTSADRTTLAGDYRGLPGWLVAEDENGHRVITSAYPDRSIEATWNHVCQLGHTHQFVLTAVALLGTTPPAIGTLTSLQDVAALYGIAAASPAPAGERSVSILIKGGAMPKPDPARGGAPVEIAAGVTTEDVRREYYEHAPYSQWITEMHLDPLQLIVLDDSTGKLSRITFAVDGEEISFADPVEVAVQYVDRDKADDKADDEAEEEPEDEGAEDEEEEVNASAAKPRSAPRLVFASRTESRPETAVTDPANTPATSENTPASSGTDNDKENADMEFSDEQKAALRVALGVPEGTEIDSAAIVEGLSKLTASGGVGAAGLPGTITLDRQVWEDQQLRVKRLEEISAKQAVAERDRVIDQAISDGKFAASRRELWTRQWDRDPVTCREVIASLQPNTIPVHDLGRAGMDEDLDVDAEFEHLFPRRS